METRRKPKKDENGAPLISFLSGRFRVNVAANRKDVFRALGGLTGVKRKNSSDPSVI